MKKIIGPVLAAALCLLSSARARAEMSMDQAAEKAIGLIEGLASIVDTDKASCDKMGTDLTKFLDDNSSTIKDLNAIKEKRTEADKKAWREKYATRLDAAQKKMTPGIQACQANDKVKAALMKMK
jgi:uncharacterized protein YdiU (UPF0061 family)